MLQAVAIVVWQPLQQGQRGKGQRSHLSVALFGCIGVPRAVDHGRLRSADAHCRVFAAVLSERVARRSTSGGVHARC